MTDIDTSKWPKPGEIWFDRQGREHGPLVLTEKGLLCAGDRTWYPSGSFWHYADNKNSLDLIRKKEPLPEPLTAYVDVYPDNDWYFCKYIHESGARTGNTALVGGKTYKVKVEFLEVVKP